MDKSSAIPVTFFGRDGKEVPKEPRQKPIRQGCIRTIQRLGYLGRYVTAFKVTSQPSGNGVPMPVIQAILPCHSYFAVIGFDTEKRENATAEDVVARLFNDPDTGLAGFIGKRYKSG